MYTPRKFLRNQNSEIKTHGSDFMLIVAAGLGPISHISCELLIRSLWVHVSAVISTNAHELYLPSGL